MKTSKVYRNVGNCSECTLGAKTGEIYNPEKRFNCNACGYYQRYNQELIEYNPKTMVIVWSSVKDNTPVNTEGWS